MSQKKKLAVKGRERLSHKGHERKRMEKGSLLIEKKVIKGGKRSHTSQGSTNSPVGRNA